jgi:hypothetical protein
MNKKEIQMLVQLREFTRNQYEQIEGKGNPVAQMRAQDAAWSLSSIVKSLDEVLASYVTIK